MVRACRVILAPVTALVVVMAAAAAPAQAQSASCSNKLTYTGLTTGDCVVDDGLVFTISSLLTSGGLSLTGDQMAIDGSNLGVVLDNPTTGYLLQGTTTEDMTVVITVAPLLGDSTNELTDIDKVLAELSGGPANTGTHVSLAETVKWGGTDGGSHSTGVNPVTPSNPSAYLPITDNSGDFANPDGTDLTLIKDINLTRDGNTVLTLASVTQDLIPVPEPASIGVFATALAGLLAFRRRRQS